MIIEKGTGLYVNSQRRGCFLAVARRSFSTEDAFYPLTVVDPLDSKCAMREEVNPNATHTYIEVADLYKDEPPFEADEPVEAANAVPDAYTSPVVFNPSI